MKIRWVRRLETAVYGKVAAGDVTDVSDVDGSRYVAAGFATVVVAPAVKKSPVKKLEE